jgi:hypothetical protein
MMETQSTSCDMGNESFLLSQDEVVFYFTQIQRCTACFCLSPLFSSNLNITFNISAQNVTLPIKIQQNLKFDQNNQSCPLFCIFTVHFIFQTSNLPVPEGRAGNVYVTFCICHSIYVPCKSRPPGIDAGYRGYVPTQSFLHLLPCLPVTSIPLCIFPSIIRCRRQFLRKIVIHIE